MNFIDSSTFLYAYLTPRSKLSGNLLEMKEHSKSIIRRVNEGERVLTSAAHISEIANIIESRFNPEVSRDMISQIIWSDNVEVAGVDRMRYEASLAVAERHNLGLNDSVAYTLMLERGLKGIYSFDGDFDRLPGVDRLTG